MDKGNNTIATIALQVLRPLVRVMLRNGVACGSFEEWVRRAYVEESYSEAKINGKKATISSVSAETGLSRKEVKRLVELGNTSMPDNSQRYSRAVRVISGWLNDRRFSSNESIALPLLIEGGEHSFAQLVKEYSGDIPTVAMLNLLESARCVEVREEQVFLIKYAYIPGNDSDELLNILGTDVNELINAIDHNLTCTDGEQYFQRKVTGHQLKVDAIPEFKHYCRTHSQALLENMDAWLSANQATSPDDESHYVSLSIFYYEADPKEGKS